MIMRWPPVLATQGSTDTEWPVVRLGSLLPSGLETTALPISGCLGVQSLLVTDVPWRAEASGMGNPDGLSVTLSLPRRGRSPEDRRSGRGMYGWREARSPNQAGGLQVGPDSVRLVVLV